MIFTLCFIMLIKSHMHFKMQYINFYISNYEHRKSILIMLSTIAINMQLLF